MKIEFRESKKEIVMVFKLKISHQKHDEIDATMVRLYIYATYCYCVTVLSSR